MVRFRSFVLGAARCAAVGFALASLAWLVVAAHRSANRGDIAPPQPTAATSDVGNGHTPDVVTDTSDFVRIDPTPRPGKKPVFLGPTKSEPMTEFEVLEVFNFHHGAEGESTNPPAEASTKVEELPIFLPSSKVLTPGDATRPILRPGDTLPKSATSKPKP